MVVPARRYDRGFRCVLDLRNHHRGLGRALESKDSELLVELAGGRCSSRRVCDPSDGSILPTERQIWELIV